MEVFQNVESMICSLAGSFSLAEEGYAEPNEASAFYQALAKYKSSISPVRGDFYVFSYDSADAFFVWSLVEESVFGKSVKNVGDNDLPKDKSHGYQIPVAELSAIPRVNISNAHIRYKKA